MKRYSITFGNGIYFDCFTSGKNGIQIGPFIKAWYSSDLEGNIKSTIDDIKKLLPDAQLSIVVHQPSPYLLEV